MKSDLVNLELFMVCDEPERKAIRVQDEGGLKVWLPRSQIEFEYLGGQNAHAIKVTLPEWLAIEKELV